MVPCPMFPPYIYIYGHPSYELHLDIYIHMYIYIYVHMYNIYIYIYVIYIYIYVCTWPSVQSKGGDRNLAVSANRLLGREERERRRLVPGKSTSARSTTLICERQRSGRTIDPSMAGGNVLPKLSRTSNDHPGVLGDSPPGFPTKKSPALHQLPGNQGVSPLVEWAAERNRDGEVRWIGPAWVFQRKVDSIIWSAVRVVFRCVSFCFVFKDIHFWWCLEGPQKENHHFVVVIPRK